MGSNPHQEDYLKSADSTAWFYSYLNGGTAGLISTIITFPFYKTVFRQQLHSTLIRQAVAELIQEGPVKLYRGVAPPLLMKSLNGTLLFGLQDTFLRRLSLCSPDPLPRNALPALAGFGAGGVEALFFTPLERVQNILQNNRNDSCLPTLRSILFKLRLRPSGYYTAFLPLLARNTLGSSLFFGLKDPMFMTLKDSYPSFVVSFMSGAFISMVISLLLYPLSVLVANMQAQVEGGDRGVISSWQRLWAARQHRLALLYRGGFLVILRSGITWGITNAINDQLKSQSKEPRASQV